MTDGWQDLLSERVREMEAETGDPALTPSKGDRMRRAILAIVTFDYISEPSHVWLLDRKRLVQFV